MAIVSIGKSFFIKERNSYPNWRSDFWRELKQNADDAGATEISVTVSEIEDGLLRIVFADNGCGMTRDVLENVYFCLGETTKNADEDSVGGFGRARILTNFGMDRYEILTLDSHVKGEGAEYTIYPLEERIEGCVQIVEISEQNDSALVNTLKSLLKESSGGARVLLNGEEVQQSDDFGAYTRDLETDDEKFAEVFHAKPGYKPGYAVVRVRGRSMYSQYLGCEGTVTVELDPNRSRSILTSNRGGLNYPYYSAAQKFFSEVVSETRTALKPKKKLKFEIVPGNVDKFVSKRNVSVKCVDSPNVTKADRRREVTNRTLLMPLSEPSMTFSSFSNDSAIEARKIVTREVAPFSDPWDDVEDRVAEEVKKRVYAVSEFIPSLPILFDTDNQDVLTESAFWHPNAWTFTIDGNRADFGIWKSHVSLLLAWKAALECTIETAMNLELLREVEWLAGFCFTDDHFALMWDVDWSRKAFLLNPVTQDGKRKFFLSDRMSIRKLIAYARHEVTHACGHESHNQDFADTLSSIDAASDDVATLSAIRKAIS